MADRISAIEDVMIAQAKLALEISNVESRTVPLTEDVLKSIIGKAPFCYIEYSKSVPTANPAEQSSARKLLFNIFVAAKSLRSRKDAQRGSYEMLEALREHFHGKDFNAGVPETYAGPFTWEGEEVLYDSPEGGTVYMQVFSTIESTISG